MHESPQPPPAGPGSRFARLAGWSYRHRWLALVVWVVAVVEVSAAAQAVGSDYRNDFSLPGTESQRALDTLRAEAPAAAGSTVQIVLAAEDGLRTPTVQQRVTAMLADVRDLPHVAAVGDPYRDPGALSTGGTIGYATVTLDVQAAEMPAEDIRTLVDTAQRAAGDGLRVELGGEPVQAVEESGGGPAEGIGMLAALVILVVLFGSVLAASLPLVIAVFAVGTAIGLAVLASHVATVAEFTTPLMILVGLGVGIDYALLLFSRFRAEILADHDRPEATRRAVDTAGRTVLFAGLTVIVALLGLVVLGLGSLQGVAVAVGLTVLATMVAALTLLPALLALLGGRIERSIRKRAAKARTDGHGWARWTAGIQRHPWAAALVAVVALLALSAPVLGMRAGHRRRRQQRGGRHQPAGVRPAGRGLRPRLQRSADPGGRGPGRRGGHAPGGDGGRRNRRGAAAGARRRPVDHADRRAGDETAGRAYPGTGGPVADRCAAPGRAGHRGGDPGRRADRRDGRLRHGGRGAAASVRAGGRRTVGVAVAAGVPLRADPGQGRRAEPAQRRRRPRRGDPGVPARLARRGPRCGARTGRGLRPDHDLRDRLRAVDGLRDLPAARMHEHWERHHDAPAAIREGMATTGRIVTAAAAIMVVVFGSFLLDPGRMLKQFGLGLAVAVLVDALIIRCLILPAVMHLFGTWAWWLPAPLACLLPRMALENAPSDELQKSRTVPVR